MEEYINNAVFTAPNDEIDIKEYEKLFPNPKNGLRFHYWYNSATTKHGHNFFEIFIILEGKVQHVYNDEITILNENSVCLMKPGDIHQFLPADNQKVTHFNIGMAPFVFQALCFALNSELYSKLCNTNQLLQYTLSDDEVTYLRHILTRVHAASNEPDLQATAVKAVASNCLLFFNNTLTAESPFPQWFADFLSKLHSAEYFSRPIHELYTLVPYSQPRLNAYFNQFMGTTLVAYVTNLKLTYSCNLLRYANDSILQIAEMSGYNNLSHFNHTFKKHIGCSPTQYRKKHAPKTIS